MTGRALIIADDLTGAAEVAAFVGTFREPARVRWPAPSTTWDAAAARLVVDTESRNLAPDAAYERLASIARRLPSGRRSGFVFKKVDSTLRGPIRAELTAWTDATGAGPVIAAPAYPQMGRTTHEGVQYLHGVPVADGPAGDDPLAPIRDSTVWSNLPAGDYVVVPTPGQDDPDELAERLRRHREEGKHVVVDAERDADLHVLASALHRIPPGWVVGTGGLARHLWAQGAPVTATALQGPVAVIIGSHHPSARAQLARLEAAHPCVRMADRRHAGATWPHDAVLVLTTPADRIDPATAARALEDQLKEVIAIGRPHAVVMTGGATALRVLMHVGADALDVVGELLPGVPIGRIAGGFWADTVLATKAGGFGAPGLLAEIIGALRSDAPHPA